MKPWRIPRRTYRLMARRAEADYPEETCGLVFGGDDSLEVVPMRNVQNELHERDPGRHPRDARTAYEFDPQECFRILAEKEHATIPLRAIYHSHPDHDAYFSATDSAAAAPLGEPSFPGALYLVFSVRQGKVVDLKGFGWSAEEGQYIEVPLEVEGPGEDGVGPGE